MSKKILNENKAKVKFSNMLLEDSMSQKDIADYVVKTIKNGDVDSELDRYMIKAMKNGDVSREMEKKVKNLVADCINNLFRTLWFRHSFYEDEIRR